MNKWPLGLKIIASGVPMLAVIIWFINFQVQGSIRSKRFYRSEFSSIVVRSNSYYGKSIEFHLANEMTVYFAPPGNDKIRIGDSVKKEKNTFLYSVYRENYDEGYKLLDTYDYCKLY